MRLWFNRTFSNVRTLFELIRQGDVDGEFHLVCTHTQAGFPGFGTAHESALEPAGLTGPDYLEFCLDFCRTRRIDLLWPGKEARLLAAHRADFDALGVRVLATASADTLSLLQDKARFYAFAQRFSIPPPDFLAFETATGFESAYAQLRAVHDVLCVKPAEGVNGAGFRVIEEGRPGLEILLHGSLYAIHLDGLRQILKAAPSVPPLLLMEFLGGSEYSVDCVADDGRLVAMVQRQKAAGGGYGQHLVALSNLEQAVTEMTASVGLHGLFNAQFREGRDGMRLLEINPRFSGGIGYTALAGTNLPYLALRGLVHGFDTQAVPMSGSGGRVLEVARYCRAEEAA